MQFPKIDAPGIEGLHQLLERIHLRPIVKDLVDEVQDTALQSCTRDSLAWNVAIHV